MTSAPHPLDESRRLLALRELHILDTPPEERFDRITRSAARMFDVPIALVTLVDAERQWFKACIGLDIAEAPRGTAFCAFAILDDETTVVRDATRDERFADNPFVTGPPHIRFYAGHPIRAPGGEAIGTLCVIDDRPRHFDAEQQAQLRDLAAWVELELAKEGGDESLQRLRHTAERMWGMIDAIAEGILSFGATGRIRFANRAAEVAVGAEPGGLVGRNVDEYLEGVSWDGVAAAVGLGDGTEPRPTILRERMLVTARRVDGSTFPLDMVVSPAEADGQPIFIGIGQDVSARVRSEAAVAQSERRFHAIFDNAGVGMTYTEVTPDGVKILDVNARFAELVGYDVAELLGGGFWAICHPEDVEDDVALGAALASGKVDMVRREQRYVRRDGTTMWGKLTVSVIRDADDVPRNAIGVFEDITERRAAQRARDEFISVVGHELRTPLTSIRGSLGLLDAGILGDLPGEAKEMVKIAAANTDRLVRLINDMLDLERLDAGRMEIAPTSVFAAAVVAEAVQAVQGTADAAGVKLEVDAEDLNVAADTDRIVQVLVNLIGNAVKFSPTGRTVRVVVERERDHARFSVHDEGRGIPADQLQSIFGRFAQVDSSDSREKSGTGLGLSIARGIVEGHGGDLWAESAGEGQGSTLRFTLRLAAPTIRLLVCGGPSEQVDRIVHLVRRLGCTPSRAGDLDAVHAAIAQARPAAIIVAPASRAEPWTRGMLDRGSLDGVPVVTLRASELSPPAGARPATPGRDELLAALQRVVPDLRGGTLLIVEDDITLGELLARMLSVEGVVTRLVQSADEAVDAIRRAPPALVVLDVALSGRDGFSIADRLRGEGLLQDVPVLVYTALDLGSGDRERLQFGRTEFLAKADTTPQEVEQRVSELLGGLRSPV